MKINFCFLKTLSFSSLFLLSLLIGSASPANADWITGLDLAKDTSGLPDQEVDIILTNLIKWLMYIMMFLSVLAFVIAGIMYTTAGADKQLAEKAKSIIIFATIGLVVSLSAFAIVYTISNVILNR